MPYRTFPPLLDDLPVRELPHFLKMTLFAVSSRMVLMFDRLNTKAEMMFFLFLLTTTTGTRVINRAVFVFRSFMSFLFDVARYV